jgi:hypothetical protein
MKRASGKCIIGLGFAILIMMSLWALKAYLTFNDCVRLAYHEAVISATDEDIRSGALNRALERAVMGCPSNGMELAGAGAIGGFVVLGLGIVKSFLDKRTTRVDVGEAHLGKWREDQAVTERVLRHQLAEQQRNLLLIQERKSQYVEETAIPLDLIKDERHTQEHIAELEGQIEELEQSGDAE